MAGVLMPERRDTLGEIAKAVNIAGNLYGIYADTRKLDALAEEEAKKQETTDRRSKAIVTPDEYSTLISRDFAPTPEGQEPEVVYNVLDPATGQTQRKALTSRASLLAQTAAEKDRLAREDRQQEFDWRKKQDEDDRRSRESIAANQLRLRELYLDSQNVKDKNLPAETKKTIEHLAGKNANKISVATQISAYIKEFQNAKTVDDQIRIGKQMIKVLNSTEGADAVSIDEAKRLASSLEFQKFNVLNEGPMFGRDLPGFETQALATLEGIKNSLTENQKIIETLKSGGSIEISSPGKKLGFGDGTAAAAPSGDTTLPLIPGLDADPNTMSEEEIDAQIQALEGAIGGRK